MDVSEVNIFIMVLLICPCLIILYKRRKIVGALKSLEQINISVAYLTVEDEKEKKVRKRWLVAFWVENLTVSISFGSLFYSIESPIATVAAVAIFFRMIILLFVSLPYII